MRQAIWVAICLSACASEPPPTPDALTQESPALPAVTRPLLDLAPFVAARYRNHLDPPAAQRMLTEFAVLTAAAHVRIQPSDPPLARIPEKAFTRDVGVLSHDATGARVLTVTSDDIALALWVERDELQPLITEPTALYTSDATTARVRVTPKALLQVDASSLGSSWVRVSSEDAFPGTIHVTGRVARGNIAMVATDQGLSMMRKTTHATTQRTPMFETAEGQQQVAMLGQDVNLVEIQRGPSRSEFVAFTEHIFAHGFVDNEDVGPPVASPGTQSLTGGSSANTQNTVDLPADAPLFERPDGVLTGRALGEVELDVMDRAGGWLQVRVPSEWGGLPLWTPSP